MRRDAVRRATVVGAALLTLAGLGWVVATQGPMAPVPVTTARAEAATLTPTVFGIGTIEARRAYELGPTAPGRVLRVMVDEGDRVAAGQLLAEMDPVDAEVRIEAARAALARATQGVAAAAAQLAEAEGRHRLAQATVRRYEQLHGQGFYSGDAVDARRHEAQAAEAAAAAARAAQVAARAETARAAADLEAAQRQRGQLRLAAQSDGIVAARHADPGATLVAGQSLLTVVDPASLQVRARIDQGRAGSLAPGQPVQIVLRSRPGQPMAGRVDRLGWVSDAVTEERIVDIAFVQPPSGVSIGELAEVTVALPPVHALAVPSASIKRDALQASVWRPVDGRARRQPVVVGVADREGRTQVVAGLEAGDTVIVHSGKPLAQDLRVQVASLRAAGAR